MKTVYISFTHFNSILFVNVFFTFRCWDQNPNVRPSIDHVVEVMRILITFCSGHNLPLMYPNDCYTISIFYIIIYGLVLY